MTSDSVPTVETVPRRGSARSWALFAVGPLIVAGLVALHVDYRSAFERDLGELCSGYRHMQSATEAHDAHAVRAAYNRSIGFVEPAHEDLQTDSQSHALDRVTRAMAALYPETDFPATETTFDDADGICGGTLMGWHGLGRF